MKCRFWYSCITPPKKKKIRVMFMFYFKIFVDKIIRLVSHMVHHTFSDEPVYPYLHIYPLLPLSKLLSASATLSTHRLPPTLAVVVFVVSKPLMTTVITTTSVKLHLTWPITNQLCPYFGVATFRFPVALISLCQAQLSSWPPTWTCPTPSSIFARPQIQNHPKKAKMLILATTKKHGSLSYNIFR